MATGTFQELLTAAEQGGKSFSAAHELLAFLRKEKVRRSDLVIKYGKMLLDSYKRRLGDEYWSLQEQVFIAALDVGNNNLANECLQSLTDRFPKSIRVARLVGMKQEYLQKYAEADKHYNQVLKAHPLNALLRKRQVAILRAQGKHVEAIKLCNALLLQFPNDQQLWQELSAIHLSQGNYRCAAFCLEELVMSNPIDPTHHIQLAEVYYTIGGADNMHFARKHYSYALNQEESPRAIYGLLATTRAIAELNQKDKHVDADEEDINTRLMQLAKDKLFSIYAAKSPDLAPLVEETFA